MNSLMAVLDSTSLSTPLVTFLAVSLISDARSTATFLKYPMLRESKMRPVLM